MGHRVLILGAGKIGRAIASFLHASATYEVTVADASEEALERLAGQTPVKTRRLDAADGVALGALMKDVPSVISALSFRYNPTVAEAALKAGSSYFDLTEDVETSRRVRSIAAKAAKGQIFMPQCGLAPGFVSISAFQLARGFDTLDTVRMRVGALPQFPANAMKYNLTWSTDGLINEYCNPCEAVRDGRPIEVLPLEGVEHFSLDGVNYEAFNTSGGLGSLRDSLAGKVRQLDYKTVRYPGHREVMVFLVNELRMREHRDLLREILERAVPVTFQDVVVISCVATGRRKGQFVQVTDARKIYPREIDGTWWSAIQVTTAAGVCAVVDLHREGKLPHRGEVRQEQVALETFLGNRFGAHYRSKVATRFSVSPVSEGEADA